MTDLPRNLSPGEIDRRWREIEPIILFALRKAKYRIPVEEVYGKLVVEEKAIYMEFPEGFLIWSVHQRAQETVRTLWLLLAYGVGTGVMTKYVPTMDELARVNGCSRIAFSTEREGWHRIAKKIGYWQKRPIRGVFERWPGRQSPTR